MWRREDWRGSCAASWLASSGLSADRCQLACVEPFPHVANSEAALANETGLLHPESPWDLGPPNPQIAGVEFLAQRPAAPCALIMGLIRQQSTIHSLGSPRISREAFGGGKPAPAWASVLFK